MTSVRAGSTPFFLTGDEPVRRHRVTRDDVQKTKAGAKIKMWKTDKKHWYLPTTSYRTFIGILRLDLSSLVYILLVCIVL